jgi:PilZ domain-containing protein
MFQSDIRKHERILVPGAAQIQAISNGNGPRLEGVVTVIGLGGMFIRTKTSCPAGSVLNIVLTSPLLSFESECTVRHADTHGIGVELTLTPENEQKLKALLTQLRA